MNDSILSTEYNFISFKSISMMYIFLDIYVELDDSGQFSTKIYDKQDDLNFKIINFPNMCSNIPQRESQNS
jgi:hypothetical protein